MNSAAPSAHRENTRTFFEHFHVRTCIMCSKISSTRYRSLSGSRRKVSHVTRAALQFIIGTRSRIFRSYRERPGNVTTRSAKCIAVCNGNGRHISSGYFDLENRPSLPEITRVRETFVTVADNDLQYLSRSTTCAMAAYRADDEYTRGRRSAPSVK